MKKTILLIIAVCAMMLVAENAQANDFLEKEKHYTAYTAGANKIHFKIPLFSESEAGFSYFVKTNADGHYSFLFYDTDTQKGVPFAFIGSENKDGDEYDKYTCGSAKVYCGEGSGMVVITNICDGREEVVPNDGQYHSYSVKKEEESDNDKDNVTWLELDWYPPTSLAGKTIDVGALVTLVTRDNPKKYQYSFEWRLARGLSGGQMMMQPELFEPYFYAVNEKGMTGYGCAAIQYTTFYDPESYHTSLDPQEYDTDKRTDKFIVQTTDTVQENFFATFKVIKETTPKKVVTQQSTKVDIPPYHRLYDFTVTEEIDATGTYTGNNMLEWHIKNPKLVDIVDGDYFQVQRALKPDFSDAKQIAVIPMTRTDTSHTYRYVDNSREMWTGNTAQQAAQSTEIKNYILYDDNGDVYASLNARLYNLDGNQPSVPVYYRVRRASSAIWGWVSDFSKDAKTNKNNYLAPLDSVQPDYTLDPEYETNRKVHFNIHIDNAKVSEFITPSIDKCQLTYNVNWWDTQDSITLNVDLVNIYSYNNYSIEYRVVSSTGIELQPWRYLRDGKQKFLKGSTCEVRINKTTYTYTSSYDESYTTTVVSSRSFKLLGDCSLKVNQLYSIFAPELTFVGPETDPYIDQQKPAIIDSLYSQLRAEYAALVGGRCMWDRTAKLVLRRTIEETGYVNEIIIPQDSIRRLEDGSWMASYTDVANIACAHINYSARIDQSGSDLRVVNDAQLQPVAIHGPSLYFDEAATITSFTASQGAAVGQQKRGVTLNWTPSSVAVDEYTLTRVAINSDAAADTLYIGQDNTFFDETAVPNRHYEYVITAHYNCNGKSTDNSATAEGWRSPYGEISGSIMMPDNSGMAGVTVALEGPDGTTVKSITTGANGAFLFDSLTYDINGTTQYAIVPTHTYAQFSYNYTSAQSASVTLSADHAIASDLNFANTSTARLTGRALYKLSTIPVAGAMFTLNGDTVLRNGAPLKTGTDGNFELTVTKAQPYILRIFKPGHVFEGEGILHVEEGTDTFAITKPLDAVRFYDETKVRLVGRVAGGIDQRDLPEAFGLGTNNIGDNVQLVLQLEGDNIAHFVHDPNDLSRDTLMQQVQHEIWTANANANADARIVGTTNTLIEKKRIIIHPDPLTGEYEVDLYPVKYKVVQASAQGYSTLFASGAGSETFDLTNAPLTIITDSLTSNSGSGQTGEAGQTSYVHYNAVYDRIFRTPVEVQLKPLIYGMEQDGYGEPTISVDDFNPGEKLKINLFTKNADGTVSYTMGHPIFLYNRKYQFEAQAYEDYYYNNDPTQRLDRVPQRGGKVTVRNGMHNSTDHTTYELNQQGKNRNVWLTVDLIQTQTYGEDALSTVSVALEQEGNTVETDAFRAFVVGDIIQGNELTATEADITLLDIIRDPGGNGSSAWVESGTTYNYSYTESYDWEAGLKLTPQWGLNVSTDVGVVAAPSGAGNYTGSNFNSSKQLSFTIPIVNEWSWGYKYSYTMTTNEKISTSTKKNKTGIGSNADVFLGVTTCQLTGKAKSITVIDDTLFQARQPAIQAGTMHVLASGVASDGKPYHLVTGEKVVLGSDVANTFAYSQYYILETVLPQLALQRQNLLMHFPDSAAAQAAADATNDAVYWYIDSTTAVSLQDTLVRGSYRMFVPTGSTKAYPDRLAAINKIMLKWSSIIIRNEQEKVVARQSGQHVGTYSVSFGNSLTHSDSYSATANYNEMPQGDGLYAYEAEAAGVEMAEDFAKNLKNLGDFFGEAFAAQNFGTSAAEALKNFYNDENQTQRKNFTEIGTVTNTSKFKMGFEPVLSFDANDRLTDEKTVKKSCGFTLVPDDQGDITVSVYRAPIDSLWYRQTADIRDNVEQSNRDEILYGSYVFFTEAGATYCIHEKEERTKFYNKGTIINNGTMGIAIPEMSIDRYEISNVPSDQRAVFHIELKNQGQVQYGFPSTGTGFSLSLTGDSNPHGAKVYINGAPLIQGIDYFLLPGQVITQVMEVERGEVDDYNDLTLYFNVGDCMKTYSFLNFSVHFQPESSPVEIASPRQNWVMNTLSQHDSVGYYLPVDISGFNIHHKNFDHIEFQYKLTKESEEMWVNQCSFYADDSLYNMATGNKAMIENGRITPFRFYGERDPMEQEYDLRAVSFCRYGSGFVSKASPVISGIKDTRPPVLFGDPEPANAILGIGDNLKLRFSEPIAGNYLDEDNNFQLRGVTNETGITAGTSIHFDGSADSYAKTKINRSLSGKSFSLDMLVRPTNPYEQEYFFSYEVVEGIDFSFGKTADNRLFAQVGQERITSKPLESPMLEFTRVIVTFDRETKLFRFFAGTDEVTDPSAKALSNETDLNTAAPLYFGHGLAGDMLEARLWTKALTMDEIAATNGHYLTGYERELLAYYRMNEGKGDIMTDKANGATLYLNNATWKLQKGISIALNNESVQLAGDLLARSQNYDETLMCWFKTASTSAPLFRAGWIHNDSVTKGTMLALENSKLVLHSGENHWTVANSLTDGEWHHFVLALSRSYNTAAVYLDGQLTNTASATKFGAVSGAMYLGGEGFIGNFDELAVFEQMLPASLIREYYYASPVGDEMGLMAYLPFQEQKLNPNGVLEQVFSVNDRRQFRDANGNVVEKVVPLVLTANAESKADKANFAPVRTNNMLSKLNFGWTFNQEELLINLKMQNAEINKQTVYVTVRDVEDLHGNPMPSPVTWLAFVDRGALRWQEPGRDLEFDYGEYDNSDDNYYFNWIVNTTGKRHQFQIESLPEWLTVEPAYGSINPMETIEVHLRPNWELPVGTYTDIIYLTDEDGLSEPMSIELKVVAKQPWSEDSIDRNSLPNSMSLRGQVYIENEEGGGHFDSDEKDLVAVFCEGQLVGLANNTFAYATNTSYVYLTIFGSADMSGKPLTFKLWQSSTGKIFNLTPSIRQTFIANSMSGISPAEPILLTTAAGEIQQLAFEKGWNWISSYLRPLNNQLNDLFPFEQGFSDGDIIKTPTVQVFATFAVTPDGATWRGNLNTFEYKYMYMMRTAKTFTSTIEGKTLTDEQRTLSVRPGWNSIAYLLSETMSTRDALADYYDKASVGDIIKSRTQFAVFTENNKWEGSLQSLKPGQGYLLYRKGQGVVNMTFVNKPASNAPKKANANANASAFSNPNAASNMTMIARLNSPTGLTGPTIRAYIGDDLVGVATPIDSLYFLTIQSDVVGTLRFETEDGIVLTPVEVSTSRCLDISYSPDAHHGSLKAPVVLVPGDNRPYKIIENNHVIIIRNNEKYDITGKKL